MGGDFLRRKYGVGGLPKERVCKLGRWSGREVLVGVINFHLRHLHCNKKISTLDAHRGERKWVGGEVKLSFEEETLCRR